VRLLHEDLIIVRGVCAVLMTAVSSQLPDSSHSPERRPSRVLRHASSRAGAINGIVTGAPVTRAARISCPAHSRISAASIARSNVVVGTAITNPYFRQSVDQTKTLVYAA